MTSPETTDPRLFNGTERVALYVAADGKCARCGIELKPGWHADHVDPHSNGGPTDVINGQALCPDCNLKKGAAIPGDDLREWQSDALEGFLATNNDYLCVATPGAGKTRFALAAAKRLMQMGVVQRVIIVAPTSHMRVQWARAANKHAGIQIDSTFANRNTTVATDFDGIAVTYSSVASAPHLYRKLSTERNTLVILDEIHHGGDELSWGTALKEAFEHARRRLLLSGTPDRSDGAAVPFVRYDEHRRFVADYAYDYGRALADRESVVRQIAFPAFDGEAKWLDAGVIEAKLRLSDVDEATRSKALRSALLPDGPWIASVLKAADKELTRQRELVPDAGGLVVAADQFKAAKYAKMLEQICGEEVTLAVSDVPDASARISKFAESTSRWIVAVAMVSEGVDIPRLVVGVYASTISTNLFFNQVAGRMIRTRSKADDSCAVMFIPSVEPLLSYAAEIERLVPRALKEAEEKAEREAKGDGSPQQMELNLVVPLAASEAVHLTTILSGDSFNDAELKAAEEMARLAGMPPSVTPVQVARLARVLGAGRTVGTTTVEIPSQSLEEQKLIVRKHLQRRVQYLARLVDRPHSHIGGDLNRMFGDSVPTATLESLKKRQRTVEQWITEVTG